MNSKRNCNGCETCCLGNDVRDRMERLGDDYQPEYAFCNKINAKHYAGGYCEDAEEVIEECHYDNPRKTGSAYRRAQTRKHKKKRREYLKYGYKPSLGHDYNGYWVPSHNSRAQKWLKRASNKKVRKMDVPDYSGYKKAFDYQWTWY